MELFLGSVDMKGQTGALWHGRLRAIQEIYLDFKMKSPDLQSFVLGSILGLVSCSRLLKNVLAT